MQSRLRLPKYYSAMIKHVVMWKLRENAEGRSKEENARLIKEKLEALKGQIEEIRYLEVGININNSNGSYDAVLITEFETMESLNSYQVNPKHQAVSAFVSKVREERAVVDFEF